MKAKTQTKKSATAIPAVFKSRMAKVFFECLYDRLAGDEAGKDRVTNCIVLADNAEEAMAKVKAVFPNEIVASIHMEHGFARPSEEELFVV